MSQLESERQARPICAAGVFAAMLLIAMSVYSVSDVGNLTKEQHNMKDRQGLADVMQAGSTDVGSLNFRGASRRVLNIGDGLPTGQIVCEDFQTSHVCPDMDGTRKWLGRDPVDDGNCLSVCQAHAQAVGQEGCCFRFVHDTNRNCRFFPGQLTKADGAPEAKSASVCKLTVAQTLEPTTAPTPAPTGEPTPGPTTAPTCPNAVAPNWQAWAALDYATNVNAGCGPEGDHQCFGNGQCVCDTCVCDAGWRGPFCSQLDLLPAKRAAPGIAMNGSHPTWGGSAVYEGGKWKLLAGGKIALASTIGLDPYTFWDRTPAYDQNASADPFQGNHPWEFTVDASKNPFPNGGNQVDPNRDLYEDKSWLSLYESEGSDAAGPYREVVRKWFKAFRADLKKDPVSDALLELSNAGGGFTIIASASGQMSGPWTDKTGLPIDDLWAGATLDSEPHPTNTQMPAPVYKFEDNGHCRQGQGAWSGLYITRDQDSGNLRECTVEEKHRWNCKLADPSFVIHSNGTTVISYRGTRCESSNGHVDHTERLGLLVADCWNCTYRPQELPILQDDEVMDGGLEDLFMWVDSRGTHMIVHSQAQDHAYDPLLNKATFHHKKKRGAYLFSADGFNRWSLSDWELFPSEIQWDDGTTELLLKQQRPSLMFDPLSGRPSHLVTGVDFLFDACCDWYAYGSGWTLVQPISTCPAGQVQDSSGSCATCEASAASYTNQCETATSKYGKCVCAQCAGGYSGDMCEICPVGQVQDVSGSCAICEASAASYTNPCETATSKNGRCVCAKCEGGYSGDMCEIEPEPIYEVTCEVFESSHECENMDVAAKWLGRTTVDAGTCLSDCQAYAQSKGLAGCCFQLTHPTNRNCRFFAGQGTTQLTGSGSASKSSSVCTRRQVN